MGQAQDRPGIIAETSAGRVSGEGIDLRDAQGVQVGDRNVQTIHVHASPLLSTSAVVGADRLAEVMRVTWQAEAKRRGIITPAPARVRWRWGPADVAASRAEVGAVEASGAAPRPLPSPGRGRDLDGVPPVVLESGVVTRLHDEVYARLPHGRLVMLGAPGAGKTGSMILLLLAALHHRDMIPEPQRGQVPVPVWLTLGGWDPTTTSLREWAVATMIRDHPYLRAPEYGPDAAATLLRAGKVALFLDGLDEMPAGVRGAALSRLDVEASNVRIVVTSRPDEYQQALADGRLHNAAVIDVQPVRPREAADYLTRDQIGAQRDHWKQVAAYLQAQPDSVASRALDNPLTLSLARSTYQHLDPTELTDPDQFATVTALREHLIDHILIAAYPDHRERTRAIRWLSWIAHRMGTSRDLAWWQIPSWIPRWKLRLTTTLAATITALIATSITETEIQKALRFVAHGDQTITGIWTPSLMDNIGTNGIGLLIALLLTLAPRLTAQGLSSLSGEPIKLRPRWLRPADLVRLGRIIVATGVTVGLSVWLIYTGPEILSQAGQILTLSGYGRAPDLWIIATSGTVTLAEWSEFWLYFFYQFMSSLKNPAIQGLLLGIPVGIAFGLYDLWRVRVAVASSPQATHREDRRAGIRASAAVALTLGLAFGLAGSARPGHKIDGLIEGIPVGISAYLVGRLTFGPAAALRRTERLISRSVRPVRLMPVLDDASQRQVLRQAGSVYQFRHAELQDHLARLYQTKHQVAPIDTAASMASRRAYIPRSRLGWIMSMLTVLVLLVPVVVIARPIIGDMLLPQHLTFRCAGTDPLAFSADSRWLVCGRTSSGSSDPFNGETTVADLVSGATRTFDGAPAVRESVARVTPKPNVMLGPNTGTLATIGEGGVVRLQEMATGKILKTLRVGNISGTLGFSPDGKVLATVDSSNSDDTQRVVRLWNIASGKNSATLFVGPEEIFGNNHDLAFAPDGSGMVVVDDEAVRLFRTTNATLLRSFLVKPFGREAALSQKGAIMATIDAPVTDVFTHSTVRLWDMTTGKQIQTLPIEEHSTHQNLNVQPSLEFSSDGKLLVISTNSQILLLEVATGKTIRTIDTVHGDFEFESLAFSPNGKLLVISLDSYGLVLEAATGNTISNIPGGRYHDVLVFSPDSKDLITDADGELRRLDPITGTVIETFTSDGCQDCYVALSPNGKWLAARVLDHYGSLALGDLVRVWDLTGHQ